MGQRANLVIVENGSVRLFYDHWCANRLDVELFWGPQYATWFIEQRPAGTDADWLDEVWCEGATVLDADRRVLLFFGGEELMDDVPRRRALLALMAETWPGWVVSWAHEGVVSVAACLGLAPARFLSDRQPDPDEAFGVLTDHPEDNRTLLTATRDGRTRAWRVAGDSESLALGRAGLGVAEETDGAAALDWPDEMPAGGVHLDIDARTLAFWWARPVAAAEARARAGWPGWDVSWLRDRYEDHLAMAGIEIRLPVRAPEVLQRSVLDDISRRTHGAATNPARALAARIGGATVNPATDAARGSVGDAVWKAELLDALSRRLPVGR